MSQSHASCTLGESVESVALRGKRASRAPRGRRLPTNDLRVCQPHVDGRRSPLAKQEPAAPDRRPPELVQRERELEAGREECSQAKAEADGDRGTGKAFTYFARGQQKTSTRIPSGSKTKTA
jgi:hypothetical protein